MNIKQEILEAIRDPKQLSHKAPTPDDAFVMEANGPILKEVLYNSFPLPRDQIIKIIRILEEDGKIETSKSYCKATFKSRHRPIATDYNILKPKGLIPYRRKQTALHIFAQDRLALWYAGANHQRTGSKGESQGLWLILRFWRKDNIQRAWKKFIDNPDWDLPEDATYKHGNQDK